MFRENLVQIQDFNQVTTKTYRYITLKVLNVTLGEKVDIVVSLFDAEKNFIDTLFVSLSGEEYTNWGKEDSYILNTVCQKLGFTLA
jgi:hypothetical protein